MRQIAILLWVLSGFYSPAEAEDSSGNPAKAPARTMQELQQESQKAASEMRKAREQQMEAWKKLNPEVYEQMKKADEEQSKIDAIVADFREGRLSEGEAGRRLRPLIENAVQVERKGLDERIARLQKDLDFLRRAKEDSDLLFQRHIQSLLGKLPVALGRPDDSLISR